MNDSSEYLANFEIYQGTIPAVNHENEQKFGKATATFLLEKQTLLSMISELPENSTKQKLHFYFDNLFNCVPLLVHFNGGTGTLRQNRFPKECPITKKRKKREWGTTMVMSLSSDGWITLY